MFKALIVFGALLVTGSAMASTNYSPRPAVPHTATSAKHATFCTTNCSGYGAGRTCFTNCN